MADQAYMINLKKGSRGGKASVVKGGGAGSFAGGVRQGTRDAGTKRFDVGGKSLNRSGRRM